MNQRESFATLAALSAIGAAHVSYGECLHGVVDFREKIMKGSLAEKALGGTCLVDGKEVDLVFYVDTEREFVRTYDLRGAKVPKALQDGKPHSVREFYACSGESPKYLVSATSFDDDGVLYRNLEGRVELYAKA